MSQKDVEPLASYRNIRNKNKADFEQRILSAFFEDYVRIAEDLDWIPSEVVDPEVLLAAKQDFPLVAANLYPIDSAADRLNRMRCFDAHPGIEMLGILQDMRNLIHGPRWPRTGIKTDPTSFDDDCKFTYVVSYQVMMCLFETLVRKAKAG